MNPSPNPVPFTSAHGRARIVKILLIVGAFVTGMSLVVETLSLVFPPLTEEQELGDNPMGAAIMLITFLIALLEVIIYVSTVVFFCVWLYRAADNLRAFNPWSRPDYSAGWAVGSFFVPFVNLLVPYRAVKEVWQKSWPSDSALLSAPNPPAWFPLWWLFWLLSNFANNISLRLTFEESVPQGTATIVSMFAGALSILAAVFAYLVVDAIDKRQEETSGRTQLPQFPTPPPPPSYPPLSDVVTPTP